MDNQQASVLISIPFPNLDCYFVDDMGNILSTRRGKLRMLKTHESYGRSKKQPYLRVRLGDDLFLVHRLVLSAKINKWLEKDEYVNHLNGVTTDNRPINLELVTHKENVEHASRTGLLCTGKAWYDARPYLLKQSFNDQSKDVGSSDSKREGEKYFSQDMI